MVYCFYEKKKQSLPGQEICKRCATLKEISMIDYIFNTIFTMRNFKLFSFVLMAGMFLFLGGCQKEEDLISNSPKTFISFDWSQNEMKFFNQNNSANTKVSARITNFRFHPSVIALYNQIANDNNRKGKLGYIDKFVSSYGVPLWKEAYIHENDNETISALLIQFTDGIKATGIMTAIKGNNDGQYTISFMTRDSIKNNFLTSTAKLKYQIRRLHNLDKKLGYKDKNLDNLHCTFMRGSKLPQTEKGTEDCEWKFVEICDNNTTYIGGSYKIPPFLDHDHDGIINQEDQDWGELLARFPKLSQDQYTQRFYEYWQDNYYDELGDFDSWFDEISEFDDEEFWYDKDFSNGFDLGGLLSDIFDCIADFLEQLFNDIYDWISELFDGDEDGDGIRDSEDKDKNGNGIPDDIEGIQPGCWGEYSGGDDWGWDDPFNGSTVSTRTINCLYYYVLICENGNWYDHFEIGDLDQKVDYLVTQLLSSNAYDKLFY
ncbi:MAG: hypothetical protein IPL08_01055 [Saprospiraceae bacterium]|nr:hypothetical protein [Saprospiraceae bacterium]